MHERHIVYVDYVSRSYQIQECRISSSTKSKLIHLGNRRSLQLQKSLPKSHCRSEEAVQNWSKRRKHQEVRQSRCRRRFSTYHDLVNLVVGDESGKHKNQEERRGTISETKKTWRTVILTCFLLWSFVILHNLCVFLGFVAGFLLNVASLVAFQDAKSESILGCQAARTAKLHVFFMLHDMELCLLIFHSFSVCLSCPPSDSWHLRWRDPDLFSE